MNKITARLRVFIEELPRFGFFIAITNMLWPLIAKLPECIGHSIMEKKHVAVFRFIRKIVGDNIPIELNECEIKHNFPSPPIWVCWLQGEELMPDLCKTCMKSLRIHARNHPVIVITEQNFKNYCYIPKHIIDKYKNGIIKSAHFADIIRTCLLYENGGLWIDVTIFVKKDLPEEIFESSYYPIKFPNEGFYITECKWSNYFLSAKPHSPWYAYVRNSFFAYLQKESRFVDYFMMDYLMKMAYNADDSIKKEVDKIPYNNIGVLSATKMLSLPIDKEKESVLNSDTYLFKLSWRLKPLEKFEGKLTVWAYLRQKFL